MLFFLLSTLFFAHVTHCANADKSGQSLAIFDLLKRVNPDQIDQEVLESLKEIYQFNWRCIKK